MVTKVKKSTRLVRFLNISVERASKSLKWLEEGLLHFGVVI